jgi:hypothetical protein
MKMTIRDLIQYLILHTDLDDTFYGFELTQVLTEGYIESLVTFDDDDVAQWIRRTHND